MPGRGPAAGADGPRVEILDDTETLARRAAGVITEALDSALRRRERASWVLAGGSTPRRLYQLLAERPEAVGWSRVALFWGDERCVDPGAATSNYRLARETLLATLPIASDCVHRVRGELPPREAARRYAGEVERELAVGPFDLVLLGLGADGHVASLFPGRLPPAGQLAAAVEAPIEPRHRITMTPAALSSTRRLVYLVQGADKAAAVARALASDGRRECLAERLRPAAGLTHWLLDEAAAVGLSGLW